MEEISKKLSQMLKYELPNEYTSASYAIMMDGSFVAGDTLGTTGGKKPKPADDRCTYNVASISKVFCSVAVMQLAEKGIVDLDAPVITYVPEFTMPDERYRKITLRHCLSHSSGLPGTTWRGFCVTEPEDEDYYAEFLEYVGHSYLKDEPGRYSVYCNDGFTLAEMAVKNASGLPYHTYCVENICKPLGMDSSRLIHNLNPEYTVIAQRRGPAEKLLIMGGAGFTSNMADLCRLGNIFLNGGGGILGEEAVREMNTMQGCSFLQEDESSLSYGLGWDNVAFRHRDFDLGEGVLVKGGYSFQFTSQLVVIPKYNAVLAISQTHDGGLNVMDMILKMFAVVLAEKKGINIRKKSKLPSAAVVKKYCATYAVPSMLMKLELFGPYMYLSAQSKTGRYFCREKALVYDGRGFSDRDHRVRQAEHDGEVFLISENEVTKDPFAQKLKSDAPLSDAWKKRFGRPFIAADILANDMVVQGIMTGFMISEVPEFPGNMLFAFSNPNEEIYGGMFEATVRAVTDDIANGFLLTPSNGSRDLITPMFERIGGTEFCHTASYTYRDCTEAPIYAEESFESLQQSFVPQISGENAIFRFEKPLSVLPKVPAGKRLLVLDERLDCVYDSLTMEPAAKAAAKKKKAGWLLFVL